MKRVMLTICALLLLVQGAIAGDDMSARGGLSYGGFSGGMMLHAGWVSRGDMVVSGIPQSLSGVTTGIGGALKFRFGDHLRIGTEGYTSSLGYGRWGSSLSIGWGGLLADWSWRVGRFLPYVGVTVGGGSVKNLTLTSEPALDMAPEEGVSYRKYGVGVVTPFVGVEYALTERMSLVMRGDWMLPLGRGGFDFPSGVRCYVGMMFNH